jgi:DNA-binding LacI/PurR family transcriptional regulator
MTIKPQITIKDLAEKLGLSISTVSRALSDHPDISIKTKKAVKELSELLGYKPNQIALNLRNKSTKTIGLIIPEISHYFFSRIISGIEDIAYDHDYSLIVFQTNESYKREVLTIQSLISNRVDGVMVSMTKETNDFSHFEQLIDHGIPFVLFDRIDQKIKTDTISVDDFEGAYKATSHLIERGCKKIALFSAPLNHSIGTNRYEGYKKALADFNFDFDEDLVFQCDTLEESENTALRILKKTNKPDGIFAVNDLSAIGAILAAKSIGISIPKELKVVGFENSLYAQITDPKLSTVDQFGYKVGQEAVKLLLSRIKSNNSTGIPVEKVIKTKLIVRESS